MKYANIFLSSLLFISSMVCTYEIRLLDQKKIDQHAAAIETKVTRDYYLRVALVSIVAARIAYMGINYFNSTHDKVPVNVPDASSQNVEVPNVQAEPIAVPKITWEEWTHNQKLSWVKWVKHVVSKENVTNQMIGLGQFVVINSFQTGMGFVMEGVYGKLNYPNTLRWYICSHVPYTATIKVIKEMVVPLQDPLPLTPEQVPYNKQLLQEACNRLVGDGEKLCGYMTYKTKQLDIEEQQVAERTTRHFFNYYNEFLMCISAQLACDVVDYNILDTMLISFETDIKRQLKLFFFIEGETDEERAMIGERVKRSFLIEQIATLF